MAVDKSRTTPRTRQHRNIEAVQADANPEKSAAMSQSASSLTRSWAKFYWEQSNSRVHPGRQRDLTIAYVEPTDRDYLSIAPTRTHSQLKIPSHVTRWTERYGG